MIHSNNHLPPPLAYSLSDACRLLSVSRATIDREVSRGRLKVLKIGCATRVTAEEMTRYLGSLPVRSSATLKESA